MFRSPADLHSARGFFMGLYYQVLLPCVKSQIDEYYYQVLYWRWRNTMPGMTPEELKELRGGLKWTQEKLARELDVSLATVQRWEMGQRKISGPVARLMRILAKHKGKSEAA